jgi:hypothetical protein
MFLIGSNERGGCVSGYEIGVFLRKHHVPYREYSFVGSLRDTTLIHYFEALFTGDV